MSTAELPQIPKRFFEELRRGGKLFGIEKPGSAELLKARTEFSALSPKYWSFVINVGIGHAVNSGVSACLPYDLRLENFHPSLQLYKGKEYQRLQNLFSGKPADAVVAFPTDMAVVSRPGASWFHCIRNTGDDTVYTYDLSTQDLEWTSATYIDFVQSSIE